MKDYKSFLTPESETWQQAIKRYIAFTEADLKEYFADKPSYRFVNNKAYVYNPEGKVSLDYLQTYAKEQNVSVPADLIDLLTVHGSFVIGNGMFEIFPETKGLLTFTKALEMFKCDVVLKGIKPTMLKSLNTYYYFFGVTFPQSDETSFLYFTKAGHFGKMYIDYTNPDLTFKKILPAMFNGTIDRFTLSTLMSNQIDRIIMNALIVKDYIDIE